MRVVVIPKEGLVGGAPIDLLSAAFTECKHTSRQTLRLGVAQRRSHKPRQTDERYQTYFTSWSIKKHPSFGMKATKI